MCYCDELKEKSDSAKPPKSEALRVLGIESAWKGDVSPKYENIMSPFSSARAMLSWGRLIKGGNAPLSPILERVSARCRGREHGSRQSYGLYQQPQLPKLCNLCRGYLSKVESMDPSYITRLATCRVIRKGVSWYAITFTFIH